MDFPSLSLYNDYINQQQRLHIMWVATICSVDADSYAICVSEDVNDLIEFSKVYLTRTLIKLGLDDDHRVVHSTTIMGEQIIGTVQNCDTGDGGYNWNELITLDEVGMV